MSNIMCRAMGCDVTGPYIYCLDHANSRLALVVAAVEAEEKQGFKPYMKNIRRALDGRSTKRK